MKDKKLGLKDFIERPKVIKQYRLDVETIEALEKKSKELKITPSQLVRAILAKALHEESEK